MTTNKNNFILKTILFQQEFRCFPSKQQFDFKPGLNVIVGDQGCGKSSLFYSIINWTKSGIAMDYAEDNNGFKFIDTETMNPRLQESFKSNREFKSPKEYDKAKFDHDFNRIANDLDIQSHGEVILPLILSSHSKENNQTFFFDEPESGLSIRSQYKIFKHFENLAKNNQVFIATHSIIIIQEAKDVLSLEHKKWMPSKEFISSQKSLIIQKEINKEKPPYTCPQLEMNKPPCTYPKCECTWLL